MGKSRSPRPKLADVFMLGAVPPVLAPSGQGKRLRSRRLPKADCLIRLGSVWLTVWSGDFPSHMEVSELNFVIGGGVFQGRGTEMRICVSFWCLTFFFTPNPHPVIYHPTTLHFVFLSTSSAEFSGAVPNPSLPFRWGSGYHSLSRCCFFQPTGTCFVCFQPTQNTNSVSTALRSVQP